MPLSFAQIRAFLLPLLVAACATQSPEPVDTGQLAREIIEEERQKAIESASQAAPVQTTTEAPAPPAEPVWQLTEDGRGLQHLTSGYVCPAQIGDFQMLGEEAFPGLGHGRDVACLYSAAQGGAIKLHLTDFGRDVSASAHLKGVVTTIADGARTAKEVATPTSTQEEQITQSAVAFQIPAISELRPDVPMHTAVWIEQFDRWHLKIRATYEADRAGAIGAAADALYARADETIIPPARIELPEGLDD